MAPRPDSQSELSDWAEPVVEDPAVLAHEDREYQRTVARQRTTTAAVNAGLMLLIVCFAGLTPVAARDAMQEMPPLSTGLARFGTAAIVLLLTRLIWRPNDAKSRTPIRRGDWPRFLLAAALCVPINQICFLGGVKLASATHAGLFYALNPVLVYLLTLMLGRARLSMRMGVAAVLAFVGAATIGWEGLQLGSSRLFFYGDVLLFGAVASWAGYTVVAAPLAERYGAIRSLSIVATVGSLMYLPAAWIDGYQLLTGSYSWRALTGFAFITLITSYLNYMLWFTALTRIDINRLSVVTNAAPLVAVVAAHYWHHDPLTAWLLLGGSLILTAITLANWDKLRALRGRTLIN